jgi:hypothetical protein
MPKCHVDVHLSEEDTSDLSHPGSGKAGGLCACAPAARFLETSLSVKGLPDAAPTDGYWTVGLAPFLHRFETFRIYSTNQVKVTELQFATYSFL